MEISAVHNIIGWFRDTLRVETRKKYHYAKGNDVTIVERRDIDVQLYNKKGKVDDPQKVGSTVDVKS